MADDDKARPGIDGNTDPQIVPRPEDIPPPDSNVALHDAEAKRHAAHIASGVGPAKAKAARERQAAQFKEAGSDAPPEDQSDEEKAETAAKARSQAPQGRSAKPTSTTGKS